MQLKFKVQKYQTAAVEATVDCFAGQPRKDGIGYRIDPGMAKPGQHIRAANEHDGRKNAELELSNPQILQNIQAVQQRQNLSVSQQMDAFTTVDPRGRRVAVKPAYKREAIKATAVHLDIEMETGTGKTYCYIKTIFEMNKRYGWSKFIVMVPSIAIREGVYRTLQITADHFNQDYNKKARFFIYNSRHLHELENFSSNSGINVMVINIQAFNASGKDNRRIYDQLDEFQSRKPIEVIAANRPILILDEPQKMEGAATMQALPKFNPLFILRYSATHRTQHCCIHRLDALDAYNQKLVKKIAVCGIRVRGIGGVAPYMYLERIDVSNQAPVARLEIEVKLKSGRIKRQIRRLNLGDNLQKVSGGLQVYKGYIISQIDAAQDRVEFTNGQDLLTGDATGDISETHMRRIQIRETIRAHLQKEQELFARGIKVLSLFFIDTVAKYRDYQAADGKGDYARVFEEEYNQLRQECIDDMLTGKPYRQFLEPDSAEQVHEGYFSIDKNKRLVDPEVQQRGENKGLSDDNDAYDLILRDEERLLSQDEPVRFIFSHSALREGWDNPNVFTMCMLKHSDNTISRRQEVGRGLRLSVNQSGERIDSPEAEVHRVNVLTVVANEGYQDFVAGLQREIAETLASRPRQATKKYFTDKPLQTDKGAVPITADMAAGLEFYLVQNGYVDRHKNIVATYHEAKSADALAELPEDLRPHAEQVFKLVDSLFSDAALAELTDNGRKRKINRRNQNFYKKEFQQLWKRINRKAIYKVDFSSEELIAKCVAAINGLKVTPFQYIVEKGKQADEMSRDGIQTGMEFQVKESENEISKSALSMVKYDLLHEVAGPTQLTRRTAAEILYQMDQNVFAQFPQNPEQFISEAVRIINEQKATMMIEKITYDVINEKHEDADIFTVNQVCEDFSRMEGVLKKHIYDYAKIDSDSNIEKEFVRGLDASNEVVVYAKLPSGFQIPTPVGNYTPDWAISFKEGSVQHIYFVAETKGSLSSMQLRGVEDAKIACARKFFQSIATDPGRIKYDVVDSYKTLIDLAKLKPA